MDIEVVLSRASELHVKINDAIERAMKSEFLQSTGGGGGKRSPSSNNTAVVEAAAAESGLSSSSPGFDAHEFDSDSYDRGGGAGGAPSAAAAAAAAVSGPAAVAGKSDVNAEARSLGSIRDALEVLEEQLKALQAMQQKQRVEKDMALAELEESRGILLGLLKKHRGHEWEVVCEALAFAGEPVDEREDLPLPPYPMSIVNPTSSSSMGHGGGDGGGSGSMDVQSPQFRSSPVSRQASGAVKRLTLFGGRRLDDGDDIQFLGGDKGEDNSNRHEEGTSQHGREEEEEEEQQQQQQQDTKDGSGFLQLPVNLFQFSGSVFGHAKNFALVVMSVLAFLAISEMGERREQRKLLAAAAAAQSVNKPASTLPRLLPRKPAASFHQCPPGKKVIMEDGHAKCIVKERIELPFVREVKTPDVLYGRG